MAELMPELDERKQLQQDADLITQERQRRASASQPSGDLSLENVTQSGGNKSVMDQVADFGRSTLNDIKTLPGRATKKLATNYAEKGILGGGLATTLDMAKAGMKGAGQLAKTALTADRAVSDNMYSLLLGKQGGDAFTGTRDMALENIGGAVKDVAGKAYAAATSEKTPDAEAPAVEGELMPANPAEALSAQNVGLNGAIAPQAPKRKNILQMETGVDIDSLPGGAFGGLNALNAAIGAMLPAVADKNARMGEFARQQQFLKNNKPTIKMQTLEDGRQMPIVMNSNGQRLDPNRINPETGLPELMLSQVQLQDLVMQEFGSDRFIKEVLENKDLSKDAKRQRVELLNIPLIEAGYTPINFDELL